MSWRDALTKEQSFVNPGIRNCYLQRCTSNLDGKCYKGEITIINTAGQAVCRDFTTIKESDR
jgi:hypothetical protein